MKRYISATLIVLVLIVGSTKALEQNFVCQSTDLKNELKPLLKPDYKYDSSKTTRIYTKNEEQVKEIEVPLFIGEKYKFLFNTKQMMKGVKIEVYNKRMGKKNRDLLYSSENDTPKENKYFFEPDKSRTMYINYTVPKTAEKQSGCVVFLLGYQI